MLLRIFVSQDAMKRLWLAIVDFARGLFGFRRQRYAHEADAQPTDRRRVGHRLVTGPSGSGKSTIIHNEAAAILKCQQTRVLVVTSSEYAARDLRSIPGYEDGDHLVTTARGLCLYLLGSSLCSVEEDLTGHLLNRLSAPDAPPLPAFTHILVDEAHNLSPALIRVIERLAAPGTSVSYFVDPAQAIFGFAGATSDSLSLLRALVGQNILRLTMRHRPLPVIRPEIVAHSMDHAIMKSIEVARHLLADGGAVAILTRTNAEASTIISLLDEMGVKSSRLSSALIAQEAPLPERDTPKWLHYSLRQADLKAVGEGMITVSTVHTFRDRTADHTVVLDTALRRPTDDLAEERRRISVGMSRATRSATIVRLADTARFLTPIV